MKGLTAEPHDLVGEKIQDESLAIRKSTNARYL